VSRDDDVATECRAHALQEHAATAEGDRAAVGLLQQPADDLCLACAEALLAVTLEGLGDRHTEIGLHQLVDLGRLQAGIARGGEGGRLPRPHEADEDDCGLAHAVIRGSRCGACRRRPR
jgi:hypothetical protein